MSESRYSPGNMNDVQLIIRQSRKKQFGYVLLGGSFILYYFIGPYDKTRIMYKQSPTFTIILGIIFFILFIYFLNELIKRKSEIILTVKGMDLRDKGFFDWHMMESFKTIYYRGSDSVNNQDLVIHFKELADIKFDISHLEKRRDELVDLILKYKGSSNLFYLGHETK